MFIHIGDRKVVSDKKVIAILNSHTIMLSAEINSSLIAQLKEDDKTIAVCEQHFIVTSTVSPYTVIKRYGHINDAVWSKIK